MALLSIKKRSPPKTAPLVDRDTAQPAGSAGGGLAGLLLQGIGLSAKREQMLREGFKAGLDFHDPYNESRLELALSSFDEEMEHALYEIIFLLHVNDPRLADVRFKIEYVETDGKAKRLREREESANLYIEGAPHGVLGVERLSPHIRQSFLRYIRDEFGMGLPPESPGHRPIASVHSIGSVGTVGHKSMTSDLDLQVVFDLAEIPANPAGLSDDDLRQAMVKEQEFWVRVLGKRRKLTRLEMDKPKSKRLLRAAAKKEIVRSYPNLFRFLHSEENTYKYALAAGGDQDLRISCLHELTGLLTRAGKLAHMGELSMQELHLRRRIERIQRYITAKFPHAEIYMFPMSIEDYRQGRYSSTIEFKESSGSAYELILNQETLLPGIQFTPVVPTHFVFNQEINDNPAVYGQLDDYLRVGLLDQFGTGQGRLVNLGSAPTLSTEYIAGHIGAAYWEAFKASSGNLPKAILNLFRYEMLLEERFLITVIQLIKAPRCLDQMITPRPQEEGQWDWEKEAGQGWGMAPWNLLEMEFDFPKLRADPWWLRYKALKIGFAEPGGVDLVDDEERKRISAVFDLAFALHVRLSDVFTKPGARREFESHREQVLLSFLERAFPPGSAQRKRVEQIFIGEVRAVNAFEAEMRELFRNCMDRVHKKVAKFNLVDDRTNTEEFELWYHFYQNNFDAQDNMIERAILHHLKLPRGRLQVGYIIGEGWYFKSLQQAHGVGARFDTFGVLDHLPREVMLQEGVGFLRGLAHCIINDYYGVVDKGTLKERLTALEFDGRHMDLGHSLHNTLAFIRPDQVRHILQKIMAHFPAQSYNYLDVIRAERKITECCLFFNLWHFGRISILSRDNLRTYYHDEYDPEEIFDNSDELSKDPRKYIQWESVQRELGHFFDTRKVLMEEVSLAVWVNPNSFRTNHSPSQIVQKEAELAELFRDTILEYHSYK